MMMIGLSLEHCWYCKEKMVSATEGNGSQSLKPPSDKLFRVVSWPVAPFPAPLFCWPDYVPGLGAHRYMHVTRTRPLLRPHRDLNQTGRKPKRGRAVVGGDRHHESKFYPAPHPSEQDCEASHVQPKVRP